MIKTRKSLWAAGFALLVCILLLIGTTFAWFTDSVSNSGNRIQAGTLQINAYAYDLAQEATTAGFTIAGVNNDESFSFEETPQNLKTNAAPVINEELWEPGKSSAKLLQVANGGTLAAKIKLDFTVTDDTLTDALWFDFVQVKDNQVTGDFNKRPMSTLTSFANDLELPVLPGGESVQFILVYGMNEEAGNAYQEKSFQADVNILATQYTYEKDGFGNDQYDAGATYAYSVETADELKTAINEAKDGATIRLEDDVAIENGSVYLGEKSLTLDLGNNTVRTTDGVLIENMDTGAEQDVVIMNGKIEQDITAGSYSHYALDLYSEGISNITIKNVEITAAPETGGSSFDDDGGAIRSNGQDMNLTMENVTVKGKVNFEGCIQPVINSGTFSAYDNDPFLIYANIGCIINGGTFKASGENQVIAQFASQENYDYEINNGVFDYDSVNGIKFTGGRPEGKVVIKGGTFNGSEYNSSMFDKIVGN